jgi:tetratricopeptide (TPR) repeat protein
MSRFTLRLIVAVPLFSLCALPCDPVRAGPPNRAIGSPAEARYVGAERCRQCHAPEFRHWSGSDHDLAMQPATPRTVLGDFDGTTFSHAGVTSTFTARHGRFFVRTDGPDGNLESYEIKYVLGHYPLQQYLIEWPGGRLQALSIAWDARERTQGGSRWFHLYRDESIAHDDPLHWTGPNQNWNAMCADCHVTGFEKRFDLAQNRYDSQWSEIDVACEACHGPGERHVAWAEADADPGADARGDGGTSIVALRPVGTLRWIIENGRATATPGSPERARTVVESCARCHARRTPIVAAPAPGGPILDSHRVALLEPDLYHADGQIDGEVYEYGSFIQSRMYRAGVGCVDCHDPHSLELKASGDGVCNQCHRAEVFNASAHHFHPLDSEGARCVGCHMPERTYMVVDPRRDHGLRIPRPDLSVAIGTPNACTMCHADRSAAWAAAAVENWYGPPDPAGGHFASALHAARTDAADAPQELASLVRDPTVPGIVRASAAAGLGHNAGARQLAALEAALGDPDPLVRMGALGALEAFEPALRVARAAPLLDDPLRAVRIEAGRVLAAAPASSLSPSDRAARERAIGEYMEAQRASADRGFAHLNLGVLQLDLGDLDAAEAAYRDALRLEPRLIPAYVNLADLCRIRGREGDAKTLLRQALEIEPEAAEAHHALGLLQIRTGRRGPALEALRRAAELRPEEARFSYVYAVALHSTGDPDRAVAVLSEAHRRHPGDADILQALVSYHAAGASPERAVEYARRLLRLRPDSEEARGQLEMLENRLRGSRR